MVTQQKSAESTAPQTNEYDVVIVGAGIAGPALAVALGNQGRKVLVVERDLSEPDRIVGELLQPGGVAALKTLGLGSCIENIDAIPCQGYNVIYSGEECVLKYPKVPRDIQQDYNELYRSGKAAEISNEAPRGVSFHHGRFVMNLRQAARDTPNVTLLEATVTEVVKNPYTGHIIGVKTFSKTGGAKIYKHYFAPLTVVCDGTFSKFRKDFSSNKTTVRSHFAGLILKDAVLPSPQHGHVILSPNSCPVLVYQVGARETRILCDIQGPVPSNSNGALKEHMEKNVMPHLPKSIQPSFQVALKEQTIRVMPNSFLSASKNEHHGLILLGDALNMRHPLTGGGMTVALNDALLLSRLLTGVKLEDTYAVSSVMTSQFHWQRKHLDSIVNILSMALYSLFAADSDYLRILQLGCFNYFKLGGICVDHPVMLLAGVLPRPMYLFTHFFVVAIYGGICNMQSNGIAKLPASLLQFVASLVTACIVIFPYIWSELT